jgi:hypothetical protein
MRRADPNHPVNVKAAVRQRDGHCCTRCGMTNAAHLLRYKKSLHVHRLEPGSVYTVAGCVTLCYACHGPEPRLPRSLPKPRVDAEVLHLARTVAAFRKVTLAEYLSEALRPVVTKDFDSLHREPKRKPPVS